MVRRRKKSLRANGYVWKIASWALACMFGSAGFAGLAQQGLPLLGPLASAVGKLLQPGMVDGELAPAGGVYGGGPIGGAGMAGVGGQGPIGGAAYTTSAQQTSAQVRGMLPAGEPIHIASFNIQVFGESKLQEAWVVEVLAQVVRLFDVVAIQEVRAKSDDVLPRFLQAVNARGARYHYVVGPRLGRTNSKEQYAFVYNTERIEVDPSSVVTLNDPEDRMHREPLIGRFRARCYPPEAGFTFWLVDVHTDPDEVPQEVEALSYAFEAVQRANVGEDDVIMLGDFNASEKQLGRLGQLRGIHCAVTNTMTNTRRNKAYDNLIFQWPATAEFTGRWGVLDLQQQFGLTVEQALKVSDHLPVWAEFTATESVYDKSLAGVPGQVR